MTVCVCVTVYVWVCAHVYECVCVWGGCIPYSLKPVVLDFEVGPTYPFTGRCYPMWINHWEIVYRTHVMHTHREMLPNMVMDECMRLHDECMRKLLAKHRGYESATEGA